VKIEDIALRELDNKSFGMAKIPREVDPITGSELSKGLKNVEGNVLKVLTALNISSYSDMVRRIYSEES